MQKSILFWILLLLSHLVGGQTISSADRMAHAVDTPHTFLKSEVASPLVFTSSDLPIVLIDTYGRTILDNPKIPAGLKIINNGPGIRNTITDTPEFDGHIGIEIRGSSSQSFPKKSFGVETWDALGNDMNVSLLGMPAENDWILNANYTDKSLLRNVLAYQVWQNMGHYGTRYRFVEVLINMQYQGIYVFSEKIKRDKNRVDIAKLSPDQNTGDEITGGYIFKIDKQTGSGGSGWTSAYFPSVHPWGQTIFFQYEYPKEEDISLQQKTYLSNYVYNFETALNGTGFADVINGYRKYAEESTFIDYFLVNEISKNVDGYRLSTFMNKERESNGGKIRMGPVWDYDIAWHNANYCQGDLATGWAYQFPCPDDSWQVPFWWNRLLQDPTYKSHLRCRWQSLRRNVLSNAWFANYIDSIAGQLQEAQSRNFTTWPILGTYVWPNPSPIPTTYQGEVSSLKSWIQNRLGWMDYNLPGTCDYTSLDEIADNRMQINIFPNPVSGLLQISLPTDKKTEIKISIINQQGVTVYSGSKQMSSSGTILETIAMSAFPPGVYLIRFTGENGSSCKRFIKI